MLEALDQVATGEVTVASRDSSTGWRSAQGPGSGSPTALPVASSSDFDEVACAVAEKLLETVARC